MPGRDRVPRFAFTLLALLCFGVSAAVLFASTRGPEQRAAARAGPRALPVPAPEVVVLDEEAALRDLQRLLVAIEGPSPRGGPPDFRPELRRLIERLAPDSPARLEAEALLDWYIADALVRRGRERYTQGDIDGASRLVAEALRAEEVGPEARKSVTGRLEAWRAVATTVMQAEAGLAAGDDERARAALVWVLELERDRDNAFRRRAQALLDGFPPAPSGLAPPTLAEEWVGDDWGEAPRATPAPPPPADVFEDEWNEEWGD